MELFRCQREDGREPFTEWLSTIGDTIAAARIRIRLRQIEAGNFADCGPVGAGVIELRVHFGLGTGPVAGATEARP
jgi:putative addiction module killer protein